MKPPEKVFKQDIQNAGLKVDEYGRPKNFLIYTTKPNFSTALHVSNFKILNCFKKKKKYKIRMLIIMSIAESCING